MKKTLAKNRFKRHQTADLALLRVAINTSDFWTHDNGMILTNLDVLTQDPDKEMLKLSEEIDAELKQRGIIPENLR